MPYTHSMPIQVHDSDCRVTWLEISLSREVPRAVTRAVNDNILVIDSTVAAKHASQVPRQSGIYSEAVNYFQLRSACAPFGVTFPSVTLEIEDQAEDTNRSDDCDCLVAAIAADTDCVDVPSDSDGMQEEIAAPHGSHDAEPAGSTLASGSSCNEQLQNKPTLEELSMLSRGEPGQLCLRQADTLVSQNEKLTGLRNQVVVHKSQAKLAAREASKSQKQLEKMKKDEDIFALSKKGKQKDGRGGRLSTQAMFSIGVRRCMTSIAAADFGIIAMFDVSGQTVIRCEQRAAAGLVHLMQSHVAEGLGMALQCSQEDSDAWSLMAVAYRADATNSSVWRRSKLHVLEASVLFVSDPDAMKTGDFNSAVSYRRCVFPGSVNSA